MNRKFILIGLLMAVFAFPANDSFVFAGKKCERSKSEVRSDRKTRMTQICNEFQVDVEAARLLAPGALIDDPSTSPCRSEQFVVKTRPRGACKQQRAHIRNRYDTRIEQICDGIEDRHVMMVETINAVIPEYLNDHEDHPLCLKPKTNSSGGSWQSRWATRSCVGVKACGKLADKAFELARKAVDGGIDIAGKGVKAVTGRDLIHDSGIKAVVGAN